MDTHAPWIISIDDPVLVTGSNGFIGTRVVKTLLDLGFRRVRCLVRPSSVLDRLGAVIAGHEARVQLLEGNLLMEADCAKAAAGVKLILHLAAGIEKSFAGCFMNSVVATRNLLEAALAVSALRRFVNVSSFAVYSNLHMKRGALLDERAPLETEPARRYDAYGYGKLKQERLVEEYGTKYEVPYVTVRPGAVYGPGRVAVSGRVGIDTFGIFLHLGGSNQLPLTYVDNCAEAIVLAGLVDGVDGQTFNIVDDDLPSSRRFLRLHKQAVGQFTSIPVPYPATFLLCALWEWYSNRTGGQLPLRFNRRRCAAEWKGNRYSNQKVKEMLGWTPKVSFEEASSIYLASARG